MDIYCVYHMMYKILDEQRMMATITKVGWLP